MVSQRRPAGPDSRARLLAAAAQEFAARGFDGAKVDRIAARARVNKAMLYYHFHNKAALYREILRDVFGAAAAAVEAVREAGGTPEAQVRAFIVAVADAAAARPHFPSIWLREMAEGGRHLDDSIIAQLRRVLRTLTAILENGRRAGAFRAIHPVIAQMGIVAPLLFFSASAPLRARVHVDHKDLGGLGGNVRHGLADIPRDAVIAHVQNTTLAALRQASPRRHR